MMMIPAFQDGPELPVRYSCSDALAGVSPEIQWMNAPAASQSFAIPLHDPEPHPQKGMYDVTHWFIWNIPATMKGLPKGLPNGADLSDSSHQLKLGNPPTAAGQRASGICATLKTKDAGAVWIRSFRYCTCVCTDALRRNTRVFAVRIVV